jgi:chromosome segregation ATPase
MVELIKSTVKCYKKKTKKMVGGRKKTYQYNQYQVPLSKSDNLTCREEVFVIPQSQFDGLIEDEVESQLNEIEENQRVVTGYEKELAELEWKHSELSRSYKAIVTKNAKTNKRLRLEEEKITSLEKENQKLLSQLQRINNEYANLKNENEALIKKNNLIEDETNLKKDQDLWTVLRSRLTKKEIKDEKFDD